MRTCSHPFIAAANEVLAMYVARRDAAGDDYQHADEEVEFCCQQLIGLRWAANYSGNIPDASAISEVLKFCKLTGMLPGRIELHINIAGL